MNASTEFAPSCLDRSSEGAGREIRIDVAEPSKGNVPPETLLAVVAHDLRTPLNGIVLSASMLEHRWREGRFTDPLPLLSVILREADRLNHLIGDLLDVSRSARAALTLRLATVTADELVQDAVAALGPAATGRAIELVSAIAAGLPPVLADRRRIEQVFANLIENALRFTPAGGRVTVAATHTQDGVAFHVTDEGPGIGADEREQLFEPFFRGHSPHGEGMGLGLFIVRSIIEAHNGRIVVETAPGSGTTFTFVLRHVNHTR